MRELFEAIRRFLATHYEIGEDRTDFYPYGNTFTILCTVKMVPPGEKVEQDVDLRCNFYFDQSTRKTRSGQRTVIFEDYKYRSPLHYVDKIVVDMLKQLPKKLEEARNEWLRSKRRQEANKIGALLHGTGISITADAEKDELVLHFRHHDKLTVMAAADHLQDNQFCERSLGDNIPEEDEEKFAARHMLRLFFMLTDEQKTFFLTDPTVADTINRLTSSTEVQS